jgi:ectoine hydroxylase-related dioxygenase (phytanoyl-CoA dioxygenase family)
MNCNLTEVRSSYEREGFVVVPELFRRQEITDLRAYTDALLFQRDPMYLQTAYAKNGAVKLVKVSSLVERDPRYRQLAQRPALVDIVEALIGSGARRFRDVLVVKPARTGGSLSYHQDSAYWDVEPKALVSCWIPLGDVDQDSSCLRVVPRSHVSEMTHGLYLRGRHRVPSVVVRCLRRMVSIAGTGDNPDGGGGNSAAWKLKQLVLTGATRYAPMLFDLQDYRIAPEATRNCQERLLSVSAGDAIFFHSLLWHASGSNVSDHSRCAEIISFMAADARFVGRGCPHFALARSQ